MTDEPTPTPSPHTWNIAGIPIQGQVILAPMEGITDSSYRMICRKFGASTLSISEFINAMDLIHGHPYLVHDKIHFTNAERPVSIQIFDNEPTRMLEAAVIVSQYKPDIIDINMGCSAKQVSNRGAGAGLLRTPGKIAEIFSSLTRSLAIPITGKIRLGWDETSLNFQEVAHIIEDNGGAAIAIHARTRKQGYSGNANWDAIAELKQGVAIPVIGNGDIKNQEDITHMLSYTQCDAVMVGRAAIGNPWIFSNIPRSQVSPQEVTETMLTHLNAMIAFFGERVALILFRKHAVAYLTPYSLNSQDRKNLLTTETFNTFQQALWDLHLDRRMLN